METALPKNQRIIVAGGTGFIGSALVKELLPRFEQIVVLTRGPSGGEGVVRYLKWDGRTLEGDWAREIDGATAIVNLVGRTVDCVKSAHQKQEIIESRLNSIHALAAACRDATMPPRVWVQAATAHIYGDTDDQIIDESSPIGTGFAPLVGTQWEAALNNAELTETRRVFLRISFVLGRHGGALKTLARLARFGLGGTVGSGAQFMSWIHQADLNRIVLRAIDDTSMQGAYVTTAPGPVNNKDFMRLLRKAVHRPWSPPTPAVLVRIGAFLMRTDPELALLGRQCVPTRLLREGFAFQFPALEPALHDLLA